jgi:hypothetical protein
MENKTLLVDVMPFEITPELIKESEEKNNGKLLVKGVIQRADSLNENKRRYPKNLLEREVKKYMRLIQERRALGELDHPDSSVVNLQNVSHLLVDLEWNNNDLLGTVEVLTTPSGNILRALFQSGVKVGISSRGLGSTRDIGEGAVEVQDDYEILCWDMVSNPSTQGGFMNRLNESVEITYNPISKKYEKVNKIVMDILSSVSENI